MKEKAYILTIFLSKKQFYGLSSSVQDIVVANRMCNQMTEITELRNQIDDKFERGEITGIEWRTQILEAGRRAHPIIKYEFLSKRVGRFGGGIKEMSRIEVTTKTEKDHGSNLSE